MKSICLPRLAWPGDWVVWRDLQSVPRLERETRSVSVASTNEKQLLNSKVMGSSKKLTLHSSRAERHTSVMRLAGRGQPHLDSDRACAHNKKPLTSTEGEWPIAMGYIGDVRASWRRRRSACKRWINSIISLCRGESDSSVTDQVPVTMQFRGGQQWRKNKKTGWGEGGQWEIKWPRCSGPEPQSLQVGSETLWRNLKISDSRPWQFTSSRILDLPSLHSSSLPPRFFLVFCWSLLCKLL